MSSSVVACDVTLKPSSSDAAAGGAPSCASLADGAAGIAGGADAADPDGAAGALRPYTMSTNVLFPGVAPATAFVDPISDPAPRFHRPNMVGRQKHAPRQRVT